MVRGLSRALVSRGHQVDVVTLDRAITNGEALRPGTDGTICYRRVRRIGPRRYPFARGLAAAVRGYDIIHVHGVDGLADQLALARPWLATPIALSTHGAYFHSARHVQLKRLVSRTLTRRTLRAVDAVWYTSKSDRTALDVSGVSGTVLQNGVDLTWCREVERRPVSGRWLVAGRVAEHKGHADLLRAIAGSRSRAPEHVEVVGREDRPGLVRELRGLAESLGLSDRVHFRGELERGAFIEAMARCAVAVFPSTYEGFGLGVVEALAAGIPVVARSIAAHRELLGDSWPGLLELAGNLDGFPAAGVLADLAARGPGLAARHDWEQRVVAFESGYRSLL